MTRRLFLAAIAAPAAAVCQPRLAIPRPNVFSTNIPYDAEGDPDTRPGTWGTAGYKDVEVPFVDVPAGKRVRITRVYGDFYAFPHGKVPEGFHAGLMAALCTKSTATLPAQSPFVGPGLGSKGCFMWICQSTGGETVRAPFDFDTRDGGLLDPDNILIVRQAVFLNDTGLSIHMETTMIVEFEYEGIA